MKHPLVLVLVLVLVLEGCKSKAPSCARVDAVFAPIAKDLDALAAAAGTRAPPTPGDAKACGPLMEDAQRIEGAQVKLATLVVDDTTVAKHLEGYRAHVSSWAKHAKKAQQSCLHRDGNAMTTAMSDSVKEHSELAPIAAKITDYCKAP